MKTPIPEIQGYLPQMGGRIRSPSPDDSPCFFGNWIETGYNAAAGMASRVMGVGGKPTFFIARKK